MEIQALQTFVAVAEAASVSRAAEALHLTQPAVSKRLAGLETELGTPLFDRIGRRLALTEAGRTLLPNARRILQELEESRRLIANLSREVRGPLSLATSHHIGLHRLPPVLRRYTRDHPQVELDLRFMDSEAACAAVEHGDLELAVVTLPSAPAPVLDTGLVWDDPLVVVTGLNHPLAGRGRVALRELAAYPAILPAVGTYTREIIARAVEATGTTLNVNLETNYMETIKMMVSIGLGWSALPRTMLGPELRELHVEELRLVRQLGTVRHRERTLSNAAQAFIETLAAHPE
ncbi:MAG: LysR family transcriptional regulator [Gammaproteobacteria bacterium]|nr:LysR family transcriptional regulator [Gammaproteobacteria bacterium]MDX5374690.1 LysR family transcriptional regulator [Gammaproteobacteria bacterium]